MKKLTKGQTVEYFTNGNYTKGNVIKLKPLSIETWMGVMRVANKSLLRACYILLLLPIWANAQVNGTIQKTASSGTVRGSFGSLGLDTLPRLTGILLNGKPLVYNSTTNKYTTTSLGVSGIDTTTIRTVANSRSLAQTQTALDLKANLASPTFTGTVTTAALNSSSFSATAVNGIASSVTNNAAGFAPLVVTNNGAGNLQTWSNSGGVVGTIGNSGAISLSAGVNATTGIFSTSVSGVAGSFTNTDATNGYGLKIVSGGTAATRYAFSVKNIAETTTFLQVSTETGKVGNVGINTDAPTEKLHVVGNGLLSGSVTGGSFVKSGGTSSQFLKADGSVDANTYLTSASGVTSITGTADQVIASASTGAVTLSLPQSIAITSTPRFGGVGVGVTGTTIGLEVQKSVSGSYVGMMKNLNTTAGTSFGLFMNAGTNASDRALNINNAANSLGLFAVLGNGALEISQTPTTSAGTYDILTRNTSTGVVEKITSNTALSGTYTPTLTNGTNVASSTAYTWRYQRVGNQVFLSGSISITGTVSGAATELGISLPIASNFTDSRNVSGAVVNITDSSSFTSKARADTANDRVTLTLDALNVARELDFSISYTVL